jgi:hypothetical protein
VVTSQESTHPDQEARFTMLAKKDFSAFQKIQSPAAQSWAHGSPQNYIAKVSFQTVQARSGTILRSLSYFSLSFTWNSNCTE